MIRRPPAVIVRETRPEDFERIVELCRRVYPNSAPWRLDQLQSHLNVFPEGQFVAVDRHTQDVLGMAASLIILWADYEMKGDWGSFTDGGMFTNHDPNGRTLYGAEVLVDPEVQRRGVGSKLYQVRFDLCRRLGLLRIRAAARLRGYWRHADRLDPIGYVVKVVRGEIKDPTLSFQLSHGFEVLAVVDSYLRKDFESHNYAAVIEWVNPDIATPADVEGRDPRFRRPDPPPGR